MSAEANSTSTTTNTVSTRPTIRVQHSGGSNEGQKANEDPPGSTPASTASTRSKVGLQRPNNKRNPEQFSLFRAASPITTHGSAGSGTDQGGHLYLALPSASGKRSTGGRSLSAASLYNENGVGAGLTDEKLLIK